MDKEFDADVFESVFYERILRLAWEADKKDLATSMLVPQKCVR